jgi:hypothetical protein
MESLSNFPILHIVHLREQKRESAGSLIVKEIPAHQSKISKERGFAFAFVF